MKRSTHHSRRGAALMLSLWALFLLSALIINWALDIDSKITLTGYASRNLEAEAAACSGAEIALDPDVEAGDSVLSGSLGRGQSYQAHLTGEGGRINLTWIVAGENPQRIEILRKYLEVKGIELNDREHMIDCLLDYVDPDDIPRLNGAEASDTYHPKNQLLQRVEELKQVQGWEQFTSQPNWEDDFTLYSSGPIDVAWASKDVLLALPGMTEPIVDRFLELRRGPDGIDGTPDDPQFQALDDVRVALGFSPEQFAQLSGLIGFKDKVMRVVSVGKSGDATRTVQMIIRKSGTPQMIRWKEL
ncbi:MAG: hypothetical protein ABI233_01050 [Chthoniobacterales bacterium]